MLTGLPIRNLGFVSSRRFLPFPSYLIPSRLFSAEVGPVPLEKIRNIAIIAHVDHGKTTLVDNLVRQSGANMSGSMDCNELERERGITILSKSTRIKWNGFTLNVIDTPGHADFGGEVERVMSMVDGVVLVVDMSEGPKTQTKFVLKKALAQPHIRPIVVVNKVDRVTDKKQGAIDNEIFDLFCSLDASDQQMEYPTLFASAKNGWAVPSWDKVAAASSSNANLHPVLDALVSHISPPTQTNRDSPIFSMLVTTLEQSTGNFGMMVTGKIYSGSIKKGDTFICKDRNGAVTGKGKVRELSVMSGLERVVINQASVGDVVSVSLTKGQVVPNVTDTLSGNEDVPPIPSIPIDPPVLALRVTANDSPLAGSDGKLTAMEAINKRLKKEALQNPAIDVSDTPLRDAVEVKGRGELQLGILVETMRREGFEMTLSPPTILTIDDPNQPGKKLEPYEEVVIVCPGDCAGIVNERMVIKDAETEDMIQKPDGSAELKFVISSRNFIGMREVIRDATRSESTIVTSFKEYRPVKQPKPKDRNGVIVACDEGQATKYDMEHIIDKGVLFIKERDRVYPGMIVGEHVQKNDMDMSVAKGEDKGDVRRKHKEKKYALPAPREMPLEACLSYINEDEEIEVTPLRIVMRKTILDAAERKRIERKRKA